MTPRARPGWLTARIVDAGSGDPAARRAIVSLGGGDGAGHEAAVVVRLRADLLDAPAFDLAALLRPRPAAVILAGSAGGRDVQHLAARLAVVEAFGGLDDGSIGIVAEIGTGAGLLALPSYAGCSRRLRAIAWSADDLASDLRAGSARDQDGALIEPCRVARTLALAAGAAAGVPAIDTAFETDDTAAFGREVANARRDGFSAKVAINEAQARVIGENRR